MKLVLTLLLFSAFSAEAQTSANQYIVPLSSEEETNDEYQYEVVIKKNNTYSQGYLNNIPAAVLAEFTKSYEGAKNVSWFVDEKATTVYFAHNDEISIVKYKQDGLVLLKRKTYSPLKIKPSLSTFIKEQMNNGDYEIRYVNESEKENIHHFEINLLLNQQWHILKILEDAKGQFEITGRVSFDKTK
jgi:hypothetical protein